MSARVIPRSAGKAAEWSSRYISVLRPRDDLVTKKGGLNGYANQSRGATRAVGEVFTLRSLVGRDLANLLAALIHSPWRGSNLTPRHFWVAARADT